MQAKRYFKKSNLLISNELILLQTDNLEVFCILVTILGFFNSKNLRWLIRTRNKTTENKHLMNVTFRTLIIKLKSIGIIEQFQAKYINSLQLYAINLIHNSLQLATLRQIVFWFDDVVLFDCLTQCHQFHFIFVYFYVLLKNISIILETRHIAVLYLCYYNGINRVYYELN